MSEQLESRLHAILTQALDIDRIPAGASFGGLGGDSLLAVEVLSRCWHELGVDLPLRALTPGTGIDAFVRAVQAVPAVAGDRAANPPAPGDEVERPGLSSAQAGLLYLHELNPDSAAYNVAVAIHLRGQLDRERLRWSLEELCRRHEALRHAFPMRDGRRAVQVSEALPELIDLDGPIEGFAVRPFDLARSAFRCGLLRSSAVCHVLVLVVHHVVCDGWSLGVLIDDLVRLYRCGPSPAPEPAVPSHGIAREPALDPERRQELVRYWTSALAGAPRLLPLPLDRPRPSRPSQAGARLPLQIGRAEVAAMRERATATGVSLASLLVAAVALLLHGAAGQRDVVIGFPIANRRSPESRRVIGHLANTVPLRIAVDHEVAPAEYLARTGQAVLAAQEHAALPFDAIVEAVNPPRTAGHHPLFQVSFTLLASEWGPPSLPGLEVHCEHLDTGASNFDLSWYLQSWRGALRGHVEFSTELFDRSTVEDLRHRFRRLLRALVRDAGPRVGDLLATGDVEEPGVEDVYPLSPLQDGMLFHTLRAERGGPYVEQFLFEVPPGVDELTLVAAWEDAMARHTALRSAFVWQSVERPLQVVTGVRRIPCAAHDLGATGAGLDRILDEDRARGFDLSQAPLMRLAILRAGDTTRLLWTVHHLVLDGWSMPLVLRDVAACYRGRRQDRPPGLPPAPPYRAFIEWLSRRDQAAAERFWRDRLRGAEPPAAPALTPGPAALRRGGAGRGCGELVLSPTLSEAVVRAARDAGVTPSTWFQGMWAIALARLDDRDEVCIGVTVTGRPVDLPAAPAIVGPLISTVVQRAPVGSAGSLRDLLRRLQSDLYEASDFAHVDLPELQRWAGLTADRPLFHSLVVFENYPEENPSFDLGDGARLAFTEVREDTDYPLTLVVLPRGSGVRLQVRYDVRRYPDAAITTLLGRLETLLGDMARDVGVDCGDLGLLGPEERRLVTRAWNDTGVAVRPLPVHRLVEEQAARTPAAPAVVDRGRVLTYGQLDRAAGALAALLAERGIGRGDTVGILQRRSLRALVSVLGVLEAGAAYLALDPGHPDAHLAFLVADAGARLVLTDRASQGRAAGVADRLVCDEDALALDGDGPRASVEVGPEDLVYITYTSGSTGRPKGIAMRHAALSNVIQWQIRQSGVGAGGRTLCYASLNFDVSFQELFATWASGGTVVLAGEDDRRDFARTIDLAAAEGVRRWYLPASALEQVAASGVASRRWLPGLSELIAGSEVLHVGADLRELLRHAPGCRLENQYGPSECHVVTSHVAGGAPDGLPEWPPIGRPIANTAIYLLDRRLRPVPAGVAGRLHIGGAGLARGYVGQPGTTAERFVPDPFAAEAGARMYDTGDRGRWRQDGTIEFGGRVDNQVKIRGFRVELAGVVAAMRSVPGVSDAVAVVREIASDRRVVGYVVPDASGGRTADELAEAVLRHLRAAHPPHLVPWAIVPLPRLPLTVNRKVDHAALPPPFAAAASVDGLDGRPGLRLLARLWADVLGAAPTGPADDFFQLGGHSISAVRLASRLRDVFPTGLGVGAIFEARTLGGLLARLDDDLGGAAAADELAERADR